MQGPRSTLFAASAWTVRPPMPVESRKANRSRNATRWNACESTSKVVLPENLIRDDARVGVWEFAIQWRFTRRAGLTPKISSSANSW